jgi:hypothetical protein
MADAAAFFASKKKKKSFKFNANLVDASTVTTTVHVYVSLAVFALSLRTFFVASGEVLIFPRYGWRGGWLRLFLTLCITQLSILALSL